MKRALPAAFAAALIAAAGFLVMPKVDEAAGRAVSGELESLRSRIESSLGLAFSFDSLSPSILRSASFSRISISAPGGRTLLSAKTVQLRYDLWALATRRGPVLTGLELSDVSLDLRLPEDQALLSRLSALISGEGGGSAPKILISGRNVSASLALAGQGKASFVASRAEFSTLTSEPSVVLSGRFSLSSEDESLGAISGPLSLSGSLSRDFSKARADLSVAAESRDFSLSTQRFELVYSGSELGLTKVKDRSPLDAVLSLSFAGGESSATLKMDGYSLSRCLRLSGGLASIEPWLEMPYSGSVTLRAPGTDLSALSFEAALSGYLPARLLSGGAPVSVAVTAKGDAKAVSVERLAVERGGDRLAYSGSFRFSDLAPDGLLDLRLEPRKSLPSIALSLRVFGRGGEYAAFADQVELGDLAFKDLAVAAARKGELVDFNLSFRPPESAAEQSGPDLPAVRFSGEAGAAQGLSLVRCEGSAAIGASPSLELSLELESLDLEPLKPLLATIVGNEETASVLSSLKMGGSLFATSDFKRLSWTASDLTVVSRLVPGAYALLSLSGTGTSVQAKRALISVAGYSVEGVGKVDFSDARKLAFDGRLSLKDIPYSFNGTVTPEGLFLSGDYGLSLSARGEGSGTSVAAKMSGLPLPTPWGLFLASASLEGRFASVEDWDAEVSELSVVPTGENLAEVPTVSLAGRFAPTKAMLSRISVVDRYSALSGSGELEYSLAEDPAFKLSAKLAADNQKASGSGSSAREAYGLVASYADGRMAGTADLVASPLARLGKLPIDGSVDGRVAVSGSVADPAIDFQLSLRDGRYSEQSLACSAAGSYSDSVVSLRSASASYQGQSIRDCAGRFSLADGSGEVSLRFAGAVAGKSLAFGLSAKGVSSREGGGSLADRLARYAISGSLGSFSYGASSVESWPFALSSSGSAVELVGGAAKEVRFRYSEGGAIWASLRPPFPLTADLSGLYDGKKIDVSVQGLDFDIGALAQFIPEDLFKVSSGRAHGGFTAIGLANDPDITGEIALEDTTVKVNGWIQDPIGPFSAPIVARGRKIELSAPKVPVGKGFISLSGQGSFDHWAPTGLTASARSLVGSSLRIDATVMGIRAQGDASLGLKMALQGDVVSLAVDLGLEKATVRVSQEVLGGSGGGPYVPPTVFLQVAANVHFGRTVQASFSPMSIPIVTGYADPSSFLAVRYDQSAETYSLKGDVVLRGGDVMYGGRSFFLKSGKISFNEGSGRFDPRVTLLAELRDRNDQGPVIVSLRAENAHLGSFTPTLSSNPVLPEAQIMALLGLTSSASDGSATSSLDIKKVAAAGSSLWSPVRDVENKARDFLGLDMLYLRSDAIPQLIVDYLEQSSSATLADYFDKSEIYVGKYIADPVFVHASVSLQEVTPLAGIAGLKIYSDLGVDLDAPFGRVSWALSPENGWNNLRFSDQSLSISWRFSY